MFYNDAETYGRVPLTLGLDQYLTGVESMIWTFASDDEPVEIWDVTSGAPMPSKFEDNMLDERVKKVAHNAQFDRNVARVSFGWEMPIDQWHCTMAQAYAHSLPGSLDLLGSVLGLEDDMKKFLFGKKLILMFCQTAKGQVRKTAQTHPEEWAQFVAYAGQDTAALREVHKRLPKHNYVGEHYDLWVNDQEINERGFFTDQPLCHAALAMREDMKAYLEAKIQKLTSGVIQKGTQRAKILNHIVGEYGFLMIDLQKDTIKKLLEGNEIDPQTRELLEIRRDSALSSLAKYARGIERAGPDGRMRYTLQYCGAGRTGRHAGRGFQPHNMPRPKRKADEIIDTIIPAIKDGTLGDIVDDVNQACSDSLRGTIIAAPGNELVVGDWSNIEGRVLAWMAKENWKLSAFEAYDRGDGPDLYRLLYAQSFGIDVDAVTGDQRQMGKVMELGCGFGGGVGAFLQFAKTYELDLNELGRVVPGVVDIKVYTKAEKAWQNAFINGEDFGLERDVYIACDALKQSYRRANPEITQLWWDVDRACKWAIEKPGSVHHVARCKIWRTPTYLIIELPSGRRLLYSTPKVSTTVEYDDETEEIKKRTSISYMASKKKQWIRERSYGGKVVENITQAIANDVLRKFMLRAKAAGYPLVLHVHDEGVAEALIGLIGLKEFLALMEKPLWWADGLPLKAAGFVGPRYKKD